MSDYTSDQMDDTTGFPMTPSKSYEKGVPVTALFTYTVPVGGITTTDKVALLKIPAGAVLLAGRVDYNDVGNKIVLGDGTTADAYLAATSIASAGSTAFFATIALGYQTKLAAELTLYATPDTGAWTAGKLIKGHVTYMMGG